MNVFSIYNHHQVMRRLKNRKENKKDLDENGIKLNSVKQLSLTED